MTKFIGLAVVAVAMGKTERKRERDALKDNRNPNKYTL